MLVLNSSKQNKTSKWIKSLRDDTLALEQKVVSYCKKVEKYEHKHFKKVVDLKHENKGLKRNIEMV